MSNTERRNGSMVWDALCAAVEKSHYLHDGWVTVGEVVREGSKTRPTVRKYLRAAAEAGYLRRWVSGNGMEMYKMIGSAE